MSQSPNAYLHQWSDEDFLAVLEKQPTNQKEAAEFSGIPRSSYWQHLNTHRPHVARQITEAANRNRVDSRTGVREQGVAISQNVQEARKSAQEMAADVTTLVGRKIRALEDRNKDLREHNAKLQNEVYSQGEFYDKVVAASTEPLPKPNYKVKRSASTKKDERAVLLPIFDMQVGAKVVPTDTIGGIGEFNSNILAERAKRYVEVVAKIIHAQAENFRIGPLVFAIGGDTVEGDEIFHDQAWQLEMPVPDQTILARDTLAWIVTGILEAGAEVGARMASVLCTPGNHGRHGKKGGRHKTDNFDVLVYKLLEEKMKNQPLYNFAIEPAGNCNFDVVGNLFSMIHGDEVRSWGSLPFYGMTRKDAQMIRTLNVIPEYVLLGHHHQPASIPIGYGEWLMSGNWVGANNLSGQVGSNTPQQSLFMVDPELGVLTREPILLDKVRKPTPTIHKTS
jgi:hypothetical protein